MTHENVPDETRNRARRLRADMTDAERRLWNALRAHRLDGVGFRRQIPIGPYIADFYCASAKLVIEVDGGQHATSTRDIVRDLWFADRGIRTIRFWNREVMTNLDGVVTALLEAVRSG